MQITISAGIFVEVYSFEGDAIFFSGIAPDFVSCLDEKMHVQMNTSQPFYVSETFPNKAVFIKGHDFTTGTIVAHYAPTPAEVA